MTKTLYLSGTALVTLLLLAPGTAPRAQVFIDASRSDVEVNLDALNALPQTGGEPVQKIVRLHAPNRSGAYQQVALYDSDTTVVGGNGTTSMALETPEMPAVATTPAVTHTHVRHHRRRHHSVQNASITTDDLNRRSLTEPNSEGLSPELARLDPAIMTSADLNRLQILCAAVPTGSGGNTMVRSPLQPAAYTPEPSAPPAPMPETGMPAMALPQGPQASIEAIPAGSRGDDTHDLNSRELMAEATPPETLGPANIPAPVPLQPGMPPAAAEARQIGRPQSPAPVGIPAAARVSAPPPPDETDTSMAALPQAPETPAGPPREVQQAAAIAPAPTPQTGPNPLTNDDLRVDFQPGAAVVPADEIAKLERVVARMNSLPDLRIELRSFAAQSDSASKARRMSLARALAIKSYLTGQGIADERIDVRALGAPDQTATDRVDLFLMR